MTARLFSYHLQKPFDDFSNEGPLRFQYMKIKIFNLKETLSIMKRLGNSRVNAFLEFKLPANQKLASDAQSAARSEFIRARVHRDSIS